MISVQSPIESELQQREWRPHKKQEELISLPFDIFEALYGGAAGGGKSEIICLLPLIYGWHEHPKFKGIILRRTTPELEAEIVGRSKEWYSHTGAIFNETKLRWRWPNGAEMRFGHAEQEKDIKKYDGVQYNYAAFDEATSFTPYQYLYLVLTRVRSATPDLPAIVRNASNPGNIGHTFFRSRFVDPFPMGGRIIVNNREKNKLFFIQCLGTENPHLLEANPLYFERMRGLPDAEYRAKALGDWYTFSGQVFSEFRIEPLAGEPENARHVIDSFEIPFWWPRFVAIDWGWQAWTYIIWAALSPDGRLYIYRTYAEKKKLIREWAQDLCDLTGSEFENVVDMAICHSAVQNRGEPLTIIEQVQAAINERLGTASPTIRLGKRDRLGGKALVHEYLRWAPLRTPVVDAGDFDPELAQRIYRNYGSAKYYEYLEFFKPKEPERNIPKLQILNRSPEGRGNQELIDTIPQCRYVEKGEKDKSPEDVAEFDGDDPYDCLRILLENVNRYLSGTQDEDKRRQELNQILDNFQQTQNWNVLHRRMEKFEQRSFGVKPVRRFHR